MTLLTCVAGVVPGAALAVLVVAVVVLVVAVVVSADGAAAAWHLVAAWGAL